MVDEACRVFDVPQEKFVEEFYETVMEVVDYVAFPLASLDSDRLVALISSYENAFFSLEYREEYLDEIVEVLRRIPRECGWEAGARFGVSLGRIPTTPYFPVTRSGGEGLSMSLLYVDYLKSRVANGASVSDAMREAALRAYKLAYEASDSADSRLALIGLDLSLSPWMEESVGALVEQILGAPLMTPGTYSTIGLLNDLLTTLAKSLRAVGFNEVMMPLAEDNRLKELAAVGQLKFRDLLSLTPLCVAGLDMVPIPSTTEEKVLKGVISDLRRFHLLKGRSIGMRLVLVDSEPGVEILLGRFGRTPVLDPLQ